MHLYAIFFLSTAIYPLIWTAAAQIQVPDTPRCYYPDGSLRNSTDYQPCVNIAGQHSMCCAIANRGDHPDICLSNGLCSGPGAEGSPKAIWREACTDPTWKSPACLNICLRKGKGYNWYSADAPITLCQDGTICCGGTVTGGKCCDQGQGVQLPTNFVQGGATVTSFISHVPSSSSSSSMSTTKAISTTSTNIETTIVSSIRSSKASSNPPAGISTDPATPNKTSDLPRLPPTSSPTSQTSSPGIPNTAKIAIGAGVAIVAVIAAALAYTFRHRFKMQGPPVYEKNIKGPFEIATSQTAFGRRSFYAVTKPPSPRQNHVNVHELY